VIAAGMVACASGHAQTPSELLSEADRLADQGNWFRAAPLYAKAEKEFQRAGDRRNELYAKFGRLHGDTEAGLYRATRAQVVLDLTDPLVEGDLQLKIRAFALLAQVRHEIGDFEFFRPDGCRQVLWPQGEFSRTAM
jgi:hypothetical protein